MLNQHYIFPFGKNISSHMLNPHSITFSFGKITQSPHAQPTSLFFNWLKYLTHCV